jgi:hypothetical protein
MTSFTSKFLGIAGGCILVVFSFLPFDETGKPYIVEFPINVAFVVVGVLALCHAYQVRFVRSSILFRAMYFVVYSSVVLALGLISNGILFTTLASSGLGNTEALLVGVTAIPWWLMILPFGRGLWMIKNDLRLGTVRITWIVGLNCLGWFLVLLLLLGVNIAVVTASLGSAFLVVGGYLDEIKIKKKLEKPTFSANPFKLIQWPVPLAIGLLFGALPWLTALVIGGMSGDWSAKIIVGSFWIILSSLVGAVADLLLSVMWHPIALSGWIFILLFWISAMA